MCYNISSVFYNSYYFNCASNYILQNLEFEYIREEVGYGTIDLLCDVGGTLSLLMGASLLTCCELLEVAWIYLFQKCCVMFPTAGPALANVAKFVLPIATNDANMPTDMNQTGGNDINKNASIVLHRRESDAQFPTIVNTGSITIPIQAKKNGNSSVDTMTNGDKKEKQCGKRKCKISQIKSDLNDASSEGEIVSVVYLDGETGNGYSVGSMQDKQCIRRVSSSKTRNHPTQTSGPYSSSSSINAVSTIDTRPNTRRSISTSSPSGYNKVPNVQNNSSCDPIQGHAQSQTPDSRARKLNNRSQTISTNSPNESANTRYLFHHFPPSTEAQTFYRGVANGGESQVNKALSTSYVHVREVPKPFYCSKPPPSPNLYIVHASTGPSLSTPYLPNGNAIASRSTVSSSTSTPTGGSTHQKSYCQNRKSASSKCFSGATAIRSSADTLDNAKSSSKKGKGLHLGSEELIV